MPQLTVHVQEANNKMMFPIARQAMTNILTRCGVADIFGNNIYLNLPGVSSKIFYQDGRINIGDDRVDMDVVYNLTGSEVMYPTQNDYTMPSNGVFRTGTLFNSANYGYSKSNTDRALRTNHPTIFQDPEIGVSIEELTQPAGFTATLTFKTNTWDAVYKVFNMINGTYNDGITKVHDFVITYPVNQSLYNVLLYVYKTKMKVDKVDQEKFIKYMVEHCQTYFSFNLRSNDIITNKKLINNEPVFTRHLRHVLEQTSSDNAAPEEIKPNQEVNAYQFVATTRFQFSMPRFLILNLPVAIYNTPLPSVIFANVGAANAGSFFEIPYKYNIGAFDSLVKEHRYVPSLTAPLYRFPVYDDWIPTCPRHRSLYFRPLIQAVYTIDEDSEDFPTINLEKDFDGYTLSDFVKDILSQHTREDILNGTGLFRIEMFSNNTPLSCDLLDYDPDTLTVTFKTRYVKTVYRIIFSECISLKAVDYKWYPTLLKYRYYFPMTIIRNLDILLKRNVFDVQPADELFKFVDYLRSNQLFDSVIKRMVKLGFAPNDFFQFTQSTNQFVDYISNVRILTKKDIIDRDPTKNDEPDIDAFHPAYYLSNPTNGSLILEPDEVDKFDKTSTVLLLDMFTEICIDFGYLNPHTKFTPRLFRNNKIAYTVESSNPNAYNAPIRIVNTTIKKVN